METNYNSPKGSISWRRGSRVSRRVRLFPLPISLCFAKTRSYKLSCKVLVKEIQSRSHCNFYILLFTNSQITLCDFFISFAMYHGSDNDKESLVRAPDDDDERKNSGYSFYRYHSVSTARNLNIYTIYLLDMFVAGFAFQFHCALLTL